MGLGLVFWVLGLGFRVLGFGFKVWGSGFRARVQGLGLPEFWGKNVRILGPTIGNHLE